MGYKESISYDYHNNGSFSKLKFIGNFGKVQTFIIAEKMKG